MKSKLLEKSKKKGFLGRSRAYQIGTIIIALCLGCSAAYFSFDQTFQQMDEVVTNMIYRFNPLEKADSRIVVVAIDGASEEQLGSARGWSYDLYAKTVDILSEEGAAVIGLDVNFAMECDDEAANEQLVNSVEKAGNVVVPINAVFFDEQNMPDFSKLSEELEVPVPVAARKDMQSMSLQVVFPYEKLKEVATLGVLNAIQQSLDGTVRNSALTVEYEGEEYDVFAVALYKKYQDYMGLEYSLPEIKKGGTFAFNSMWNTNTISTISIYDLLSGDYDPEMIAGKVVIVGEYEQVSYSNPQEFYEVKTTYQETTMNATVLQALLDTKSVSDISPVLQAILYGVFITMFYLLFATRRRLVAILGQFIWLNVCTGFFYGMNIKGYRFMLLVPMTFAVISVMVLLGQNALISYIDRKRMEKTLKMYMDSKVVDQIGESLPFQLSTLSERRNVAVLFVDVRGFTTMSEQMDPKLVVDMLNEYFTMVYAAIESWNGTIDKFIGDAVMAIFNAPNEDEDYIFHAACAADDIQKGFVAITEKYRELYGREIHVGVGVNAGEAIVGNIGCFRRMDYTAIGDTVNTASRLESKAGPDQVLISRSVKEAIEGRAEVSTVGALALKGKSQTVDAYEIIDIQKPKAPNVNARKEIIREARALYTKLGADRQLPEFFKGI